MRYQVGGFKAVVVSCLGLAVSATSSSAQSVGADFFETKIRPVLATNCYGCHSSKLKSPMGGLVLDTKAGMLKGGASGPVLNTASPADSLLLRALNYKDLKLKMPPTGKLASPVLNDFEQWIAAGAPDPRKDTGAATLAATGRVIDFEKGKQWWAFQPVKEMAAPTLKAQTWPKTKIDSFVLAKLEKSGLTPSPEADPRTLIRRVYLDLIGLKPTYEEVEAFANDSSPQRYEKLVDRLMASPQYGERWGRYWLDVVRYGEDGENPAGNGYLYAWRYRDWVIDALNKDVPYDHFVKLQLAADKMPGTARDDFRALGFLGTSPAEHKEMKLAKTMIENLLLDEWDERLDVVARGVMGLTVACARCHDHKFDPITAKDYYALAGVFASTANATRPLHDMAPADETRFVWIRQRLQSLDFVVRTLSRSPETGKEIALTPESVKRVTESKEEIAALRQELTALVQKYPELTDEANRVLQPRKTGATAAEKRREAGDPKAPFLNAVYDAGIFVNGAHPDVSPLEFHPGEARDLPVFFRGNAATPGDIVPRRFLTVLSKDGGVFKQGSGRLELGDKIFSDAAPLTARVIVNRVWGWHFDKPLVATPSDFGTRGEPPTHPELLDDLAARFIANGWSLKWLHREIMLSATYRQSSHPRADAEKADPANQLLWRMNPRRMDIEAYRDSLLEAAGQLNLSMQGPSIDLDSPDNRRRTVYGKIGRGRMNDLLRLYDFPSPIQHSPARVLTITPLQQLFVMNSPFIEGLSATLAKSVEQDSGDSAKVRDLYRKIFARDPAPNELDLALSYLNRATLPRLAQALLATNEETFWP